MVARCLNQNSYICPKIGIAHTTILFAPIVLHLLARNGHVLPPDLANIWKRKPFYSSQKRHRQLLCSRRWSSVLMPSLHNHLLVYKLHQEYKYIHPTNCNKQLILIHIHQITKEFIYGFPVLYTRITCIPRKSTFCESYIMSCTMHMAYIVLLQHQYMPTV